jgi:hypothetical protein
MSDIRVKIEPENDNAKRRTGAGNFSNFLSSGGSGTGLSQRALMADFLDDAWEDHKLDNNELEGMKVLAGMPSGAQAAPSPATRCPADETKPHNFKAEVAAALDKSKDWDSGEQMAFDTAQRLVDASDEQQMAFVDELWKLISDNDVDEASDGEGTRLDAFVDGLFATNPSPSGASPPGKHGAHKGDAVGEFLCQAMRDNKLNEQELARLRTLINGASEEPPARAESPRAPRPESRPAPDHSSTELQRLNSNMDWLVSIGAISIDVGERVKARRQHG